MRKEIESIGALLSHIGEHKSLDGVAVQGLDLRAFTAEICSVHTRGAVFLGCQFTEPALAYVTADGATIFPRMQDLPYSVYRANLYTLDELMAGYRRGVSGSFYKDARDSKIYNHFKGFRDKPGSKPIMEAMAQRLHDHFIDDALDDLLHDPKNPRRTVAIMGGHAMTRDETVFREVARMARALARRGLFVATGGGPGAMEAGNLGAWFAGYDDAELETAIDILTDVPSYKLEGYIDKGYEVRERWPKGTESLAIPTWFYGHEPTNHFATHIAKYFSNSLREDGLLAIAHEGVIYAPGSAGTIQEVFMDATQNHYGTFGDVSPMVFFGANYWTDHLPVFPLLTKLAEGRQYRDRMALTDDIDEIVAFIEANPPVPYKKTHKKG